MNKSIVASILFIFIPVIKACLANSSYSGLRGFEINDINQYEDSHDEDSSLFEDSHDEDSSYLIDTVNYTNSYADPLSKFVNGTRSLGFKKTFRKSGKFFKSGIGFVRNIYGQAADFAQDTKELGKQTGEFVNNQAPNIIDAIGKTTKNGAYKFGEEVIDAAKVVAEFGLECLLPPEIPCKPKLRQGSKHISTLTCDISDVVEIHDSVSVGDATMSATVGIQPKGDFELEFDQLISFVSPNLSFRKLSTPPIDIGLVATVEYNSNVGKYQKNSDSSDIERKKVFDAKRTIKRGATTIPNTPIPIVWEVYAKAEIIFSTSITAAAGIALEINLPTVRIFEGMELKWNLRNGEVIPDLDIDAFKDLSSNAFAALKDGFTKGGVRTNGGSTYMAAMAMGVELNIILGFRCNGYPIEIPFSVFLSVEISAAGFVTVEPQSDIKFSSNNVLNVEASAGIRDSLVSFSIPTGNEMSDEMCDVLGDLSPDCFEKAVEAACFAYYKTQPIFHILNEIGGIDVELFSIEGKEVEAFSAEKELEFGTNMPISMETEELEMETELEEIVGAGYSESSLLQNPPSNKICSVQEDKGYSKASCIYGQTYACNGSTMTVDNGCRAKFTCNYLPLKCESFDYKQKTCTCSGSMPDFEPRVPAIDNVTGEKKCANDQPWCKDWAFKLRAGRCGDLDISGNQRGDDILRYVKRGDAVLERARESCEEDKECVGFEMEKHGNAILKSKITRYNPIGTRDNERDCYWMPGRTNEVVPVDGQPCNNDTDCITGKCSTSNKNTCQTFPYQKGLACVKESDCKSGNCEWGQSGNRTCQAKKATISSITKFFRKKRKGFLSF